MKNYKTSTSQFFISAKQMEGLKDSLLCQQQKIKHLVDRQEF